MPGRFEGVSGAEWELFEDIFLEKARKGRGMPAVHPRKILNSLLFADRRLPALRSAARRALGIKKFKPPLAEDVSDGRLEELKARLPGVARNEGLICRKSGAADGSFSLRKRRRDGGGAGQEGKGVLIRLPADAEGMPPRCLFRPANEDERRHAGKLLAAAAAKTGKAGRPRKNAEGRRQTKDMMLMRREVSSKRKGFGRRLQEKGMQARADGQ